MRRPRLLIVTPDYPPATGGIQLLVREIAGALRRFNATVIAVGAPGAERDDRDAAVPVRRVPAVSGARVLSALGLNAAAVASALAARADVVLSAHIVASPAAALLSRWRGIPFAQYVYAKELGARPKLARFAVTRANAVIAISEYARELSLAAGANPGTIRLIPPGVSSPRPLPREPAPRPTILTVARLQERYKGHDVMARALPLVRAAVPDVEWVVAGDGPLRPALEALAEANGVRDSVRFCGMVSDAERDELLRGADVFAMTSRLPADGFAGEGFGIVYLEAGAHRVATVAGNVGGSVDAVADGRTGVLVDPNDHLAVAGALTRLLLDHDERSRLAGEGPAWADRFSWSSVAERVESVLLELVGR